MQSAVARGQEIPPDLVCQRVTRLRKNDWVARCLFSDQSSIRLPGFVARFIRPPDRIEFDPTAPDPKRELRVLQDGPHGPRELYLGLIGYVAQPKSDKHGEYFVRAATTAFRLGLKQLNIRNEAVRDYFYFPNRRSEYEEETFYDLLRAARSSDHACPYREKCG